VADENSPRKFYTVDFVGRRSAYAHDLFPNGRRFIIVVDRVMSMQNAVPEMSEADMNLIRTQNPAMSEACLERLAMGWGDGIPGKYGSMFPDEFREAMDGIVGTGV
jgi:hypothetical protein